MFIYFPIPDNIPIHVINNMYNDVGLTEGSHPLL